MSTNLHDAGRGNDLGANQNEPLVDPVPSENETHDPLLEGRHSQPRPDEVDPDQPLDAPADPGDAPVDPWPDDPSRVKGDPAEDDM